MMQAATTVHVSRSSPSRTPGVVIGAVLVAWFAVAALASQAGWLVTEPGAPPLKLLAAVVLPVILFAGAYVLSQPVRDYVRAGDPLLLTTLQSWRILGGTFLVLMSFGMLPAAFALPAGLGDVAIGVSAPFAARAAAAQGLARFGRIFTVWQFLGVLDLVVAVGTGASMSAFPQIGGHSANPESMSIMSQLPLSLIPAFAVPVFIILHLATVAQTRARNAAHGDQRRNSVYQLEE
jgi:hypothetical protein